MHETHGMPLDILLDILKDYDMVVDWCGFLDSSIKVQWKVYNTIKKLEVLLTNMYGKGYSEQVIIRLKIYYMEKHYGSQD